MEIDAPIEHPAQYREFFALFNARRYYEAHEVLEDLWIMETGPLRNYYKGLIMSAVALLHWHRGNRGGARKLYLAGEAYLSAYGRVVEGFDLGGFRGDLARIFAPLVADPQTPVKCPPMAEHPVLSLR